MIKHTSPQPSLSRDFTLLALVIIFIAILVGLYLTFRTLSTHKEETKSLLSSEASRIERILSMQVEHSNYLLQSLGKQILQDNPNDINTIARLLQAYDTKNSGKNVVSWADNRASVIVSSNHGILKQPLDISDRDYIKKALADPWNLQIGRPVFGRVSDRWISPLALGITDYGGNYRGTIIISMDISMLNQIIRNQVQTEGMHFAILSRTLNLLTEDNQKNNLHLSTLPSELFTEVDVTVNTEGLLQQPKFFSKQQDYIYYRTSNTPPYILLLGYDGSISKKEIYGTLFPRILQVVGITLFLVSMLWVIRIRIMKPVEDLADIAASIARGNTYQPLTTSPPAEIDYLAEQIRRISLYLTERGRVEEELLLKNTRLRNQQLCINRLTQARLVFLHEAMHELQTFSNQIRERIEAVKDQHFGSLGNETYIRHATEIFYTARSLERIISETNTIITNEYAHTSLIEKPVNVTFAVHRAIRYFHQQPHAKHIEIKPRGIEEFGRIMLDEQHFHLILIHLLNYAALNVANNSPIILEFNTEDDAIHGQTCVMMLKYQRTQREDATADFNYDLMKEHSPEHAMLRSESIALAYTSMLLSVHQASMHTDISENGYCRIYIRFHSQSFQPYTQQKSTLDLDEDACHFLGSGV